MQNEKYYRHSIVGREHCRWTEDGKRVLEQFINDMTYCIYESERESLDRRSKDLMLKELGS